MPPIAATRFRHARNILLTMLITQLGTLAATPAAVGLSGDQQVAADIQAAIDPSSPSRLVSGLRGGDNPALADRITSVLVGSAFGQAGLYAPQETGAPAVQLSGRPAESGPVFGVSAPGPESPVLGRDKTLGEVSAPIMRFRDGGHAYYLFGKGLHSCTYVGRCMDLFAAIGEPVYAMADGILNIPPYAPSSYGKHIVIKHRDGTESIYAHLDRISVQPGPVAAGARIGTVGCSGTSGEPNECRYSAAHLHLEWSGLQWDSGEYGELPPFFLAWRGTPRRCFQGC